MRGGYGIFYQQTDRYGCESQLGLNLPQLVDASITANSGTEAPAFTFAQGFTPLNPSTVNPRSCSGASRIPTRTRRSCTSSASAPSGSSPSTWWRRSSTSATASATAAGCATSIRASSTPAPGRRDRLPVRAVRLRQRVPRADHHRRRARLQLAPDAAAAADDRRPRLHLAYTFGSAKGDFLDHLSAGGGAVGNTPQNTYDLDADYGPLPFDVRHRLVTSFVYELPWARAAGSSRPASPARSCATGRSTAS